MVKKYQNGGGYVNPQSTEAAIGKLGLQLIDPTGFSSYPDVYYSFNLMVDNPSLLSLADLTINVIGALPLLGKVSIPFKAAKTTKLLSRIGGVNKFVRGSELVYRVNRAIDTFPELIPGVRKLAEKTLDFTTKYVIDPLFLKLAHQNKLIRTKLFRNANSAINYINAGNTISDFTYGLSDISNSTGFTNWILEYNLMISNNKKSYDNKK